MGLGLGLGFRVRVKSSTWKAAWAESNETSRDDDGVPGTVASEACTMAGSALATEVVRPNQRCSTVMRFCVRVPVLSEAMTWLGL